WRTAAGGAKGGNRGTAPRNRGHYARRGGRDGSPHTGLAALMASSDGGAAARGPRPICRGPIEGPREVRGRAGGAERIAAKLGRSRGWRGPRAHQPSAAPG